MGTHTNWSYFLEQFAYTRKHIKEALGALWRCIRYGPKQDIE